MKKIRFILSLVAVAAALGVSSFTMVKKASLVDYAYTYTDASKILDATAYVSGTGTGCNGGSQMPCTVEFDNATYADLQTYLNHEGTAAQVIHDAPTKRHN